MLTYKLHLIQGLFFEVLSFWEDKEYTIKFYERRGQENNLIYQTSLKSGMSDYHIEIWDGDILKEDISLKDHLKGKRVFISLESKSLGDTIAWIPYCEEFRKTYECEVVVSSFLNHLFEKEYPSLEFVGRGVVVENIVAMIELGWFYDKDKEPTHPATIPLQQAATNILGLEYKEVLPKLNFTPKKRPLESKYVCIATHSTSGLKYWSYWQEVIDYLLYNGYKVVEISKDDTDYKSLIEVKDKSIPSIMNYLYHCEFYIGLSSGLSWLAWALEKKVIMIANFSTKDHEFQGNCTRIVDESICHGCWNDPLFKFNKGDWYWCPRHEDTPRHFECHKLIKANKVIEAIEQLN
jgi:autotransporter strand-loop-strand O-heptosyltransferase